VGGGPARDAVRVRPKGEELRLCQRYYQVDATGVPFDGGSAINAGVGLIRGRQRGVPHLPIQSANAVGTRGRLLEPIAMAAAHGNGATSLTALSAAEVTSTRMTIIGALNTAAAGRPASCRAEIRQRRALD
jgi:hypothetical protein